MRPTLRPRVGDAIPTKETVYQTQLQIGSDGEGVGGSYITPRSLVLAVCGGKFTGIREIS